MSGTRLYECSLSESFLKQMNQVKDLGFLSISVCLILVLVSITLTINQCTFSVLFSDTLGKLTRIIVFLLSVQRPILFLNMGR